MTVDCFSYYYPSHNGVDVADFLARVVLQLQLGGTVSVRDLLLPERQLRGKKGRLQAQTTEYVDAFLRLGWPTHGRRYRLNEWQTLFRQLGLVVTYKKVTAVAYDFHTWAAPHTPTDRLRLQALLTQAPEPVLHYLTPLFAGDRITFHLQEILIIGSVASDAAASPL